MTSISINKNINNLLTKDETLVGLVGDKIYPLIAESDTAYPFVVFKRQQVLPTYTKDWLTSEEINIEVVCASNKYFESVEVAEAVRNILECYRDKDIKETKITYITEDFMDDCYTQRITFNIII